MLSTFFQQFPHIPDQPIDILRACAIVESTDAQLWIDEDEILRVHEVVHAAITFRGSGEIASLHGDTVNPSVAIASPAAGARVSDPTLSINGTAADNTGVALVEYRLENAGGVGAYQPATGTLQWSAMVTGLIPGTNTLRVRARDVAGRYSPEIVRQVVFVVVSPLTVLISGSGVVTPALDGQLLEVGRSFTLTAKPGAGFAFSNWTGAMAPAGSPTLSFLMQSNLTLSANFVPNPFPVVAGAYAGLFWEGESVRQGSSGFFTLATTASGAYSGALILDGVKLPVSGQLSLDGGATNVIPRRGADPVSVAWTVDLHGANQVTGLVSTASWHARLAGDRALLNAGTNHTMPIGKYTFVLPGATDEPSKPEGDGFGTAGVDGNGKVNLAATLADGTRFAAAGPLLQGGMFPLYTALYGKRGSVLSWVAFDTNQPNSDMSGLFSWIRPPAVTPKTYTNGFELESALTGSRYVPPAGKTNRIVEISNGFLLLSGAGLLEPSTNAVILGPNNALTNTGSNKLTLTLTASSGLFKGTFMQTGTTERVSFSGAVLQKTRRGSGYFLRAGRSGQVLLQPQPSP